MRMRFLFTGILLLGLLAAFGRVAAAETVTVFAAASLKEALDENVRVHKPGTGDRIVVSYAASSALAKQIENGAPADLFISADLEWMDYLAARKLIDARSRSNLLSNRLVLIAPAGSSVKLDVAPNFPLAAALGSGRLSIADPEHVPAGKYARSALESLGVWGSVAGRTARAENVRAALVLVSRGEAPLGIVYRTDALADGRVRTVAEFPESSHPPIVYPAALIASTKSLAARDFLEYLKSQAARALWTKHGFALTQ
jgi:molybdate transport system substrate-binding protein